MLKLLIADDEIWVRNMLINILQKLGIGREQIQEAGDGEELLRHLELQHFHAAFVDIRMPLLSGLDAIKTAVEKYPTTNFYILSGYCDFQYIQKALRLGVKDYCLKPINANTTKELLEKLETDWAKKINLWKQQLRGCALDFWNAPADRKFTVDLPGQIHGIYICSNSNIPYLGLYDRLSSILQYYEDTYGALYFYLYKRGEDVLIVCLNVMPSNQYFENFRIYLKSELPVETTVITVRLLQPDSAEQLRQFILLRPVLDSSSLDTDQKIPGYPLCIQEICHTIQEMSKWYQGKDYIHFNTAIKRFVSQIQNPLYTDKQKASILRYVCNMFSFPNISLEDVHFHLSQVANLLLQKGTKRDLPKEIIEYLETNYRNNIGVNDVAEHFNLTPNYVTTVFKKKAGMSIINYLTYMRIEASKKLLLETSKSIKDISSEVGYYSSSYFIRRFVQLEGLTPNEFREKSDDTL